MRIRVIDLETTGIAATDHVVEIGAWDFADGEIRPFDHDFVACPVPIPPEVSAVHHIIDEDIAGAVGPWGAVWDDYRDDSLDAYCAHNAIFERQFITPPMTGTVPWVCTYRCALRAWPDAPSHKNQALRYWLKPTGLDRAIASESHRAYPDAYVTAFILRALLEKNAMPLLLAWSAEPALMSKINFGKHAGKKWAEVPRDYIDWLLRQTDMSEDVKFSARHHLKVR